jgi:hypothetical protein
MQAANIEERITDVLRTESRHQRDRPFLAIAHRISVEFCLSC